MSQNSFVFLEIEKNKQYFNKTYYQDSELHPILLLINSKELRNEIKQYIQLTVTNRPKLLSEPIKNWYKSLNRQITGSTSLQSGIPYFSINLFDFKNFMTKLNKFDIHYIQVNSPILWELYNVLQWGYYDDWHSVNKNDRLVIISEG